MATPSEASSLPPDLFDRTTVLSLASTLLMVLAAYLASRRFLPPGSVTPALRFLFIWHGADALCHFILEGSFLYHCFFSYFALPVQAGAPEPHPPLPPALFPTPYNYLGFGNQRVYGPQAGGSNPFAQLWMVYARADRRWAGTDLDIVSLELLTVFLGGPLACYVCYLIAKGDARASIWMIILATCELYGGFMTFCPEWLTGNVNLDTSNFMYLWVYLVFFNMLWVFIPLYALSYSFRQLSAALDARGRKAKAS